MIFFIFWSFMSLVSIKRSLPSLDSRNFLKEPCVVSQKILSFLTVIELARSSAVSKKFKSIAEDDRVWIVVGRQWQLEFKSSSEAKKQFVKLMHAINAKILSY